MSPRHQGLAHDEKLARQAAGTSKAVQQDGPEPLGVPGHKGRAAGPEKLGMPGHKAHMPDVSICCNKNVGKLDGKGDANACYVRPLTPVVLVSMQKTRVSYKDLDLNIGERYLRPDC